MLVTDWRGLYREGWKGEIVAGAFAHPAKYARALVRYCIAAEQTATLPTLFDYLAATEQAAPVVEAQA